MAPDDPQAPRRLPGGAVPRRRARPLSPSSNGHRPPAAAPPARRPLGGMAGSWEELDAEDEAARAAAGRTEFRRVIVPGSDREVRAGRLPSPFVAGLILVVALVVLVAVLLYRAAPP